MLFRDVLPRDLRHGVFEGHPAHEFFERWMKVWKEVRRGGSMDSRESFKASVKLLRAAEDSVSAPDWMVESGMVIWKAETLEKKITLL